MNNKHLCETRLEDYSFPRYASATKAYYGTWRDILALIDHLRKNEDTSARYSEIIEAVETYDNDNVPMMHCGWNMQSSSYLLISEWT